MKKTLNNEQGFTLLEILVVLTIMGFLIAMVAPRLAGISGGAVDTVCDSNQNRMVTYMSSFFEQTNRFPNKLTNIVEQTGGDYTAEPSSATFQVPAVSDQDPENGAETLAAELFERNHFVIHYLDSTEVSELKNMGIVKVLNLNAYDAYDDTLAVKTGYDGTAAGPNDVLLLTPVVKSPVMESVTIKEGLAVTMIGCGSVDITAVPAALAAQTERGWGEADHFGRIVFGMGPECSLITSGVISNAAHCPGGIQNADNVTYNDYNLVLPRLSATSDRMAGVITNMADADGATEGLQVQAAAYDDEPGADYDVADQTSNATNLNLRVRTLTLTDAQETWQFATQCPEGHVYPEDDGAYWGIDFNGAADQIN